MEHGCCLVVLLALAAGLWDVVVAYRTEGCKAVTNYLQNGLEFRHDIEDHLNPGHTQGDCGSPTRADGSPRDEPRRSNSKPAITQMDLLASTQGCQLPAPELCEEGPQLDRSQLRREILFSVAMWVAYLSMGFVYAGHNWWTWFPHSPVVGYTFRFLDTACHSTIWAMIGSVVIRSSVFCCCRPSHVASEPSLYGNMRSLSEPSLPTLSLPALSPPAGSQSFSVGQAPSARHGTATGLF